MQQVTSEDLLKFGLIPEFIGRIPITAALEKLTEEDLISILTEPKNALVKQYKKQLSMDNVVLEFEEEALQAIAQQALERGTGARGLRSIIENVMLEIMYEVPSREDIAKIIITKENVEGAHKPEYYSNDNRKIS